ncbi:MAG: TAXI family TRAP transporter solute-binding subunit, partial [Chromatocurvus sp.]
MMKTTCAGLALIACTMVTPAAAQDVKLSLAAGPQGSVNYVLASGFGTVISRYTKYRVTVVPYQGTTTLLPAISDGRHQAGVNDAGSVYEGFNGVGQFKTPHKSLRLLSSGSVNHIAIAVRADSDIKTAADLKGRKVTAVFAALPICKTHSNAILDNLGIKWSEVRQVPVTNIIQAAQSLADGRVDAMLCAAPAIAKFREIHARTPLRFIGIDASPAAM